LRGAIAVRPRQFPESLEDWIDEDNRARVVDVFVEELDLAELGFGGVDPEAVSSARQSAIRHRSDRSDNESRSDPRHGGVQVSTSGAPQQNQAPDKESHPIHSTQEVFGSALRVKALPAAARVPEEIVGFPLT
jgi:hypothetical protein